jgi:hypothetical protein
LSLLFSVHGVGGVHVWGSSPTGILIERAARVLIEIAARVLIGRAAGVLMERAARVLKKS